MSRRGDNIHKRKDGRWEGRYKDPYRANNKYLSVYAKTYTECKMKLESAKSNIEIEVEKKKLKFSMIMDLWMLDNKIRLKKSTQTKYGYMINKYIRPELGELKLEKVNSFIINNFLNKMLLRGSKNGNELSPAYVRTLAIILGSIIKYAIAEEYCVPLKNPILKPQLPKKEIQILSDDSYKTLLCYLQKNLDETAVGISIALNTGMRIGEICALKWNDIDFVNETINVCKTVSRILSSNGRTKQIIDLPKTKSSIRVIPISSPLMVQLKNFFLIRKSEFVVSTNSFPVDTRTFDYRFKKIMQKANIPQCNFHTLRHTFATNCINHGVDVKALSEFLGHSSVSTTLNTYVHLSLKMKKQQIEKIAYMT